MEQYLAKAAKHNNNNKVRAVIRTIKFSVEVVSSLAEHILREMHYHWVRLLRLCWCWRRLFGRCRHLHKSIARFSDTGWNTVQFQ